MIARNPLCRSSHVTVGTNSPIARSPSPLFVINPLEMFFHHCYLAGTIIHDGTRGENKQQSRRNTQFSKESHTEVDELQVIMYR